MLAEIFFPKLMNDINTQIPELDHCLHPLQFPSITLPLMTGGTGVAAVIFVIWLRDGVQFGFNRINVYASQLLPHKLITSQSSVEMTSRNTLPTHSSNSPSLATQISQYMGIEHLISLTHGKKICLHKTKSFNYPDILQQLYVGR